MQATRSANTIWCPSQPVQATEAATRTQPLAVLQGTGHVSEWHDMVRHLLIRSYACRKIDAAFQ